MKRMSLSNLLLLFCAIPYGIASVLVGYYLSFIPKEVKILRVTAGTQTAIVEQQSIFLWCLFTIIIFIWGFVVLKIICECIYRILSLKRSIENKCIKENVK